MDMVARQDAESDGAGLGEVYGRLLSHSPWATWSCANIRPKTGRTEGKLSKCNKPKVVLGSVAAADAGKPGSAVQVV